MQYIVASAQLIVNIYNEKSAMLPIVIGATEATKLELLKSIANWLFENQNYTIFRLPQITVQQRSEQRLQVNYAL